MYMVDWDQKNIRRQTIEIRGGATDALLDRRDVRAFHGGKYLTWKIRGRVVVEIHKVAGNNAVLNGMFFAAAEGGSVQK